MGRVTRGSWLRGALLGATLLAAAPAHAEPSLSDRETARGLMDEGDAKRAAGDVQAALTSYEAADALMHVPTTGYEVARAQAQLGLLLEARETLARLRRLPLRAGEPAPFKAARHAAELLDADVGARLPSITIVVVNAAPGAAVELSVDGEAVPSAAASLPRKVNPGRHAIAAKAGVTEKSEAVVVVERETRSITFDLTPPPRAATPAPVVVAAPPSAPPPSTSRLPTVLVVGGFGAGAIGLGLGSVTGILSLSKVSAIKKDCSAEVCPASRQSDLDSARSLGAMSTVAFIVGGAGLAAGIVGLLLAPSKDSPRAALDVGPTGVGAHGWF